MKHGDISNRESPIIAFNIDTLLFKDEKPTGIRKLTYALQSDIKKYLDRPLNMEFVFTVDNVWRDFDYSVYFITFKPFTKEIEDFLVKNQIPYTRLLYFEDVLTLRKFIEYRCIYYFDIDSDMLEHISLKNALPFNEISHVL